MSRASNECAVGPPGADISDGSGGVMALGSKSLTSVDKISGSRSGSWVQLMGPQRMLGEIGSNLNV